jgi:hypothetical protein
VSRDAFDAYHGQDALRVSIEDGCDELICEDDTARRGKQIDKRSHVCCILQVAAVEITPVRATGKG